MNSFTESIWREASRRILRLVSGRKGKVGACGAGAAGSETQPYLEGGIEAVALSGGGAETGCPGFVGAGDQAYRRARWRSERQLYVRGGNRVMSPSKPA